MLVAFVLPLKNVFLSDLFLGKRRWKKKKKNYSGQDMWHKYFYWWTVHDILFLASYLHFFIRTIWSLKLTYLSKVILNLISTLNLIILKYLICSPICLRQFKSEENPTQRSMAKQSNNAARKRGHVNILLFCRLKGSVCQKIHT